MSNSCYIIWNLTAVPVWLEFVQFAIGGMEEEDGIKRIRETFERALSCVGLHASQGSHIWDAFREFESAVLAGLMVGFIHLKKNKHNDFIFFIGNNAFVFVVLISLLLRIGTCVGIGCLFFMAQNYFETSTTPSCGGPLRTQKSPVASFHMPASPPQIWSKMKIS